MFRIIMLSLVLAACATPGGAYMDGAPLAPVEPRVTYAPAGAGLPEYWGSPEAPKVERSPHRRELPPTREPGLWAGDQPRSARVPWADWPTTVLGVELPIHPGLEDEIYAQQTRKCAFVISRLADEDVMRRAMAALSAPEIRCLVARLHLFCTWEDERYLPIAMRSDDRPPPALRDAIHKNYASAQRFEEAMCKDVNADALTPLVRHGVTRWVDVLRSVYAPN